MYSAILPTHIPKVGKTAMSWGRWGMVERKRGESDHSVE